jgi:5-oxoprolinase (ATP-hydrolysing) subunit C
LIRDPSLIPDLLSYQLISGVTRGDDLEQST